MTQKTIMMCLNYVCLTGQHFRIGIIYKVLNIENRNRTRCHIRLVEIGQYIGDTRSYQAFTPNNQIYISNV